ncbi:mannonate dehydratase [Halomicroarcula limicola]|uniref:mannonate dehydratase n=1 Tax=Haloarcula limicola TaxID=1429915 RepID=A0A8J8C681_9EURY|nr:mannonate dehydratase [Halomicroarcula limicola]MBV0925934.1 mannonate dehydratase [Halomicroarcula limicola]
MARNETTDTDSLPLRSGLRTRTLSDERLRFCRQIGVEDIFLDHRDPRGDVFEDEGSDDSETITIDEGVVPSVSELVQARRRAEDAGLRLMGIQSLSYNVYGKIMLGKDGQETQLETIKDLIRNVGQADIPILGYQWNPRGVVPMRTSQTVRLRGDARGRGFDIEDIADPYERAPGVEREYEEAELWENYERFLEAVLPVAEEAGVRLALHPADPPTVEQLGGIPRLFRNFEAFQRAMELVPSDNHGLKLCLGCFSEMPDTDVTEVIEHFGANDDIVFVHFRDVIGTWPNFTETFVDDDQSNFDALDAIEALQEVGFDGVMVPDHVPEIVDDTEWGHRSRAHAIAYLNGLLACSQRE